MSDRVAWAIGLGVLGAIVGSFLAVLVLRWPQGRTLGGRSACDACERTLRVVDLVPLLSGLALEGRCRGCGARIDPLHWRMEAGAAAIGAAAGLAAAGPVGLAGAVFGWLLLGLGVLDARAFWLPDRLTAVLAAAGVVTAAAGVTPSFADRAIGGVAGFVALSGIAAGYRAWRGHDGMGGGDPKLFGAIGLWLGWRMLPSVLLVAALAGLGVVLVRYLLRRPMARDDALPLGTLLAIAAYPAWLMMIGSTT